MDLWEALRVLARRWLVVVPLLLLAIAGAYYLYSNAAPQYRVSGSLLMRSPSVAQDEDSGRRNPYLDYGNLAVPARVVVDVALTSSSYTEITDGSDTSFELGLDTTTSAPLITLTVQGATPEAVQGTAQRLVDFVNDTLEQRQLDAGAPEETLITTEVVTPPVDIVVQNSSRTRLFVGAAGVGTLLAVGAGFLAEALTRLRTRMRGTDRPGQSNEPVAETAESPAADDESARAPDTPDHTPQPDKAPPALEEAMPDRPWPDRASRNDHARDDEQPPVDDGFVFHLSKQKPTDTGQHTAEDTELTTDETRSRRARRLRSETKMNDRL